MSIFVCFRQRSFSQHINSIVDLQYYIWIYFIVISQLTCLSFECIDSKWSLILNNEACMMTLSIRVFSSFNQTCYNPTTRHDDVIVTLLFAILLDRSCKEVLHCRFIYFSCWVNQRTLFVDKCLHKTSLFVEHFWWCF